MCWPAGIQMNSMKSGKVSFTLAHIWGLIFLFLIVAQPLKAQYANEITVAQDGSGDYRSIQEAIYSAKAFPDKRITIYIKAGIYREKVRVPSWNTNITLKGENAETTKITWDDHFKKIDLGRNSTFYTATLLVEGEDFRAENLSIENTAGPVGQAIALAVEADRCVFKNCRIKGNQDTLYTAGTHSRQYFTQCYIEGTTDFIFGEAVVLFDSCQIHSKSNSYITAASTPEANKFGFVFRNCRLTAADNVDKVYLGRPWRKYARVAYLHCYFGAHIAPEGWQNWSGTDHNKTAYYAEFGNTGPGSGAADRVSWSLQLRRREARYYSLNKILGTLPGGSFNNADWISSHQ